MGGADALMRVATQRSHWVAVVRETEAGFRRNDLLTYASAIAFQLILALAPFLLMVIALLGFFDLDEVWSADVAPELRPEVSGATFTVIDDTVRNVLGAKREFWLTAGLVLAIWEISGAVRGAMGALDRIYESDEERGLRHQLLPSILISIALAVLFVIAVAVVRFVPFLLPDDLPGAVSALLFVVRWAVAAAVLAVAVGLLVHSAPCCRQPLPWVSFGTSLVIVAWVGMSIVFGIYLTEIASYGSVFGQLATFFVALGWVYYSSIAFLGGLQVDAVIRGRVDEEINANG